MKTFALLAIPLALGILMGLTAAQAQTTQLTPAPERLSDAAIQSDYIAYEQLQARLHQLNERGIPVRNYHLSKAQCWLDVSLHEYTRNDRSAFPQEALTESEKLVVALEQGGKALPMDTPLVNGATKLRPDLWASADALKLHSGLACAAQQLACAEVELVHAGNEFGQQQWRHAKPYVQIAEEALADASRLAAACAPTLAQGQSVAKEASALPAGSSTAPVAVIALQATVLFDFDRHGQQYIRPASLGELQQLLARIKLEGLTVQSLSITGHADRLHRAVDKNYNLQLSQKRVNTVRDLLAAEGLRASSVATGAMGDAQELVACSPTGKKTAALQECLLPNRRVEVRIEASK
jgi:outer membrane protein OmpA-like peptidoglycan-associated protein